MAICFFFSCHHDMFEWADITHGIAYCVKKSQKDDRKNTPIYGIKSWFCTLREKNDESCLPLDFTNGI